MSSRDEFFQNVRRALGRTPDTVGPEAVGPAPFFTDAASKNQRADAVRREAAASADELMSRLRQTAESAGWTVAVAASADEAAWYIESLARDLEARSILCSTHPAVGRLKLEERISASGIEVGVMAIGDIDDAAERESRRRSLRDRATRADIGVTGVDYAIAETGTCVLLPRKGVSRLVSLLPPVHVAVVERGQVLPGLDELFTLRGEAARQGNPGSYMNLISGPSRTADIDQTLVTGVHGPGEVHMVLIG
jgi:L-lactate utilization protein LutC